MTDFSSNLGDGVQLNYDQIIDICMSIENTIKAIDEQWEKIDNIIKNRENVWRGPASDKYFEELKKFNAICTETTNSNTLRGYVENVRELVDANRNTDRILSEEEITRISDKLPTIQNIESESGAQHLDTAIIENVTINDNIEEQEFTENVEHLDEETIDSVTVNDNVEAQESAANAEHLDEEAIDSVTVNGNIGEQQSAANAEHLDEEAIDRVEVNSNINTTSSNTNAEHLDEKTIDSVQSNSTITNTADDFEYSQTVDFANLDEMVNGK